MRIIIWTSEAKGATETSLLIPFFSNGLLHFKHQHAGGGSGVRSSQKQYSELFS